MKLREELTTSMEAELRSLDHNLQRVAAQAFVQREQFDQMRTTLLQAAELVNDQLEWPPIRVKPQDQQHGA